MKSVRRALGLILLFVLPIAIVGAPSLVGAPGGGAGAVKVRVASGLKEKDATQLQRYLQADGYGAGASIELAVDANGTYSVLIGPLESEAQGQALIKDLQESGYQPEGIVAAEGAQEKVVSRAEAGRVFRVQVGEFPDRRQAEGLQQTLMGDDYAGVDIVEDGGVYRVVIGVFATERDAQKLLDQLRGDGYSFAKTIETREVQTGVKPTAIEQKEIVLPAEAQQLSPEEQEKAKDLIRIREKASAGLASADEIVQLREELKKLRSEVANVVKIVTTNEQANREKLKKMRPIQEKFNNAILNKNLQEAEQALEELRAIDPNDSAIPFYIAQLNTLRTGATAQGQRSDDQKRLQQLISEAKASLEAKRFDDAQTALVSAKVIDPANPEVEKLSKQLSEARRQAIPQQAPASTSKQILLIYVGAGLLLIIVGTLAIYVFVTSRRERKLIEEVQHLTAGAAAASSASPVGEKVSPLPTPSAPAKEEKPKQEKKKEQVQETPKLAGAPGLSGVPSALGGVGALNTSILSQVAVTQPEPEPEEVEKSAPEIFRSEAAPGEAIQETRPPGEADVLVLNDIVTSSQKDVESQTVSTESEVKLPDIEIPLPELDTQTVSESSSGSSGLPNLDSLGSVDLEELLGGKKETESEGVAMTPASQSTVNIHEEITVSPVEEGTPEQPVSPPPVASQSQPAATSEPTPASAFDATTKLPAVEEPSPAQQPSAVAQGKKIVFQQTFDDEEPGAPPQGWQGEYDYATLVVDTTSPAPGSKACLKFEKRTGAGSAHYACHFPKATGLVTVEFDIRCDEKNKYLLGFYIEKDEDFKQSVHTIIHRLDSRSQPTLRVQGEPVPYELGTWRHVKYELNLLSGTATAYVDGQEVVRDAKLASNYGYVNTLSIRDNLATTGILYLDNIIIYQS